MYKLSIIVIIIIFRTEETNMGVCRNEDDGWGGERPARGIKQSRHAEECLLLTRKERLALLSEVIGVCLEDLRTGPEHHVKISYEFDPRRGWRGWMGANEL